MSSQPRRKQAAKRMGAPTPAATPMSDEQRIDRRVSIVAVSLFCVMWLGTMALEAATGTNLLNLQYVTTGVILLGMNVARYLRGIQMSWLTLVMGLLALAAGTIRQLTGEFSLTTAVVLVVVLGLLVEVGGRKLRRHPKPPGA